MPADTANRSRRTEPVVVVGAGWAGLSAALHLCRAGVAVRVLEAAPQAGGRARRQVLPWPDTEGVMLDNGQHLMLGAYRDTLSLIAWLGAGGLRRLPLYWENAAGLRIQRHQHRLAGSRPDALSRQLAVSLSLPGALLSARGLTLGQRWHVLYTLGMARLAGWRPARGVRCVTDWYRQTRQPEALIRQFWDPLVISAMNTPPATASAQVLLRILQDSLGKAPEASDFVLNEADLGAVFVDPALAWLKAQGNPVELRTPVHDIQIDDTGRRQDGAGQRYRLRIGGAARESGSGWLDTERMVLACPAPVSARLLEDLAPASFLAPLQGFSYPSITTAYVGWRQTNPALPTRLPDIFSLAVTADGSPGGPAHWFFSRGEQQGWRLGALVVSDSAQARDAGDAVLVRALQQQLHDTMGLPTAEHLVLVHEKRATFACTDRRPVVPPGYLLPQLPGVLLAGDYSYGAYPATLESAVRSGRMAAEILLADQD